MKRAFLFYLLLISSVSAAAQSSIANTYAIVIGISSYQDPGIRQLNYSNRDAIVFSEFLMSAPGGSVPKKNIKLLTDSMATIGEVDKAIRWLVNNCQQNDKVFFYFSGHGEMENVTMNKNGYLICYNTPSVAFVNMGLSIDYLNDVVNTIAVQTKAKVVVITDACHSGKMNGDKFKGNFFVGKQLMLKKQNEIRMASCKPDELSNENADWGGGRGVFSYYLINALQGGLADINNDGIVSVGELKAYMDTSMAKDAVLKNNGDVQTPVINGAADFELAKVIESERKRIKEQLKRDSFSVAMLMASSAGISEEDDAEPADYFSSQLKKQNLEAITDSLKLNTLGAESIVFAIINNLSDNAVSEKAKSKLLLLKNELKNDKIKLNLVNLDLASTLLDAGQSVITNYIRGDVAELERRRYYNSKANGYDVYIRMFSVALKLSQADRYNSTKAAVFLHYFSGLVLRLKIPLAKNQAPLIQQALAEQKKALALEERSAYIFNELGVLYSMKNNLTEAEKYFKIATTISPRWAIPFINLANLYIGINQLDKATLYLDTAKSLQSGLADLYNGYGIVYEKNKKLLQADEAFHKSIKLNSVNYLPFERLGLLNINTGNYAEADSIIYEAALRKKGYTFNELPNPRHVKFPKLDPVFGIDAIIDPATISSDNIMGHFALGCQAFRDFKLEVAETEFRKVIALDPCSPLAYHYLGRTLFEQKRWQEAELIFKQAIADYMPYNEWQQYYNDVYIESHFKYIISQGTEDFFRTGYYKSDEDTLLLAQLYEQWEHYDEAETYYRGYQQTNLENLQACLNLVKLYERTGAFNEAENILKAFYEKNNKGLYELLEFYERMVKLFPENGEWFLKAGLLQYALAQNGPENYRNDVKAIDPFSGKIEYASEHLYETIFPNLPLPRIIPYSTKIPVFTRQPILKPFTSGIYYLKNALATLPFEEKQFADINVKIGNLYSWQGLPDSAALFFEAALELNPADAGIRNKLTVTYAKDYRFADALEQLDSLSNRNQLSFEKQLMLARFKLQDGDIDEAGKLIGQADLINPGFSFELTLLKAKLATKSNNIPEAIANYKMLLEINGRGSIQLYNIARLYAVDDNKKEALSWLQLALNAGFNYKYVLQYDPAFGAFKKDTRWLVMFKNCNGREYPENDFYKWNVLLSNLDEYTPLFVQ